MPHRLARLLEASRQLTTETSLDVVLQRVADVAVEVIGAKYAALGVLGSDRRTLDRFITSGMDPAERARIGALPRGHGILGLVIREARVIRLPDLQRHPDSFGFPPHHPPMRSFLGVPVLGRDGIFGDLYLTEKEGAEAFTEEDEAIAIHLASLAAAAVENARLHGDAARLLEELQGLLRNRERFFAMVNHEMRNALTAVHGWAELVHQPRRGVSVEEAAKEVLDASELAVVLVNDLLDLSRLDENRLQPVINRHDPADLARRAAGRARVSARNAGVAIAVEIAPDLAPLHTDDHRVLQILQNLFTNAIRHSPRGGTIRLVVAPDPDGGFLRFQVLDEGPGVAPQDLERIFDAYETRGHEPTSVGLGLAVSRRLATLLGGTLRAIHQPGGGGRFDLRLPIPGKEPADAPAGR